MNCLQTILEIEKQIQLHLKSNEESFESTGSANRINLDIENLTLGMDPLARKRVWAEFKGFGPIDHFLSDEGVTEILINSSTEIWYETGGLLTRLEDQFASETTYRNFLERLYLQTQSRPTKERPMADGNMGSIRVHMAGSDITQGPTKISLRRHPTNPWTLQKLISAHAVTSRQASVIQELIQKRKNIIVAGSTGSGKTSLMNACLQEMSINERVITIEDCHELKLRSSCGAQLYTRTDSQRILPDIDQAELIRQALRMRPDRIVVGEVRGGEAKDLLLALSTGHSGGMGSIHAEDPHQALMRLEFLVQIGAPQWSVLTIRKLMSCSIQYIFMMKRQNGIRVLQGIYQITSLEETGLLLEKVD